MTQIDTSLSNDDQAVKTVKTEDKGVPTLTAEEGYAYFGGRIVPMSEAKVSIATHSLQYGTACFEGIRAYWNANHKQLYLLKLREHYNRMADSWNVLRMQPKASYTIRLALSHLDDQIAIYTFPMGNYVDISMGLKVCTSSWRRANSNAMLVGARVHRYYKT